MSYVCGGEPYGEDQGCGLYFCGAHLYLGERSPQRCVCCIDDEKPFDPKPDSPEWIRWKLDHESWAQWRAENPYEVAVMQA